MTITINISRLIHNLRQSPCFSCGPSFNRVLSQSNVIQLSYEPKILTILDVFELSFAVASSKLWEQSLSQ